MSAVYDKETNSVYISARELCAFVLRKGSLDKDVPPTEQGHTIVPHTAHNKKPYGIDERYILTLKDDDFTTVIYATQTPEYDASENKIFIQHFVSVEGYYQAKILAESDFLTKTNILNAYIAMKNLNLPEIEVRTVISGDGEDEKISKTDIIMKEKAEETCLYLQALFAPFAKIIKQKGYETLNELSSLRFPFESGARDGQREFIIECARTIKSHKRLVVEAPTGTGKTMASVYPALKSIGLGYGDKLFYLTGKTTTARSALNAIEIMREQLPNLRAIHISAKDKACLTFKPSQLKKCKPRHCKYTKSYFEKINIATLDLLENYRTYTREIIEEIAKRYEVCPYELALEISEWCEMVVCDYNYLFDPQAYLRRYFDLEKMKYNKPKFIFLVDEAHNLPDRAREMYSITLNVNSYLDIRNRFLDSQEYMDACDTIINEFDRLHSLAMEERVEYDGQLYGFYMNSKLPSTVFSAFSSFYNECQRLFKLGREDDDVYECFKDVRKLFKIAEFYDESYTMYVEAKGDSETKIRIMCLDPSPMLDINMKKGVSSVLFSATLTPFDYFVDVLGCAKSNTLSLKSPFDKKNQCLICINNISTRYDDRESSSGSVASVIRATVAGKEGKYIVYFPSYTYLSEVMEIFQKKFPTIQIIAQDRSMSENAKADFLSRFDESTEGTLVGFCVMGGSFSEGIDLRGERLIGAMIVGVGLPTISTELNIIKEHYDKTRENGYAYTYTYPGMIKVMQAAGRVIRSENERGVVVLLDDRFATPEYRGIMPEHWSHMKFINNAKDLLKEVTNFWKND